MENQINDTIKRGSEENRSSQANRVFTDAYSLQIAEQVLTNIERVQLKVAPKSFDVKKIRGLLGEYKTAANQENEEFLQLEFLVLQELHLWRLSLARRDEAIKTFHLRRFYDGNSAGITNQILSALGCFYRSLTPSFEVRSKYDFVVTQLFSIKLPDSSRYVRYDEDELIARLQQFNAAWTGIEYDWADDSARRARQEAVAVFEALRIEAENFRCLEDLLKSNFFKRVRRHKQYLGEIFFAPEVTAASIQCNIAVGNKFSRLVADENESFRVSLEAEHGGIDVLNLMLEQDSAFSITLLKKINLDCEFEPEDENFESVEPPKTVLNVQRGIDADNFHQHSETTELANSSDQTQPENSVQTLDERIGIARDYDNYVQSSETEPTSGGNDVETSPDAENRRTGESAFSLVLSEIDKPEPSETVLREYLNSASESPVIAALDLSLFLNDARTIETDNDLKREALRLILIAEDYRQRVRNKPESLPNEQEINSLKGEIQIVIDNLRAATRNLNGENRKDRTANLSAVVDNLFQARLRLVTAYSKFATAQEKKKILLEQKAEKPALNPPDAKEIRVQPKKVELKSAEPPKVNRGLLALTVLTVIFGVGYFFYPSEEGAPDETMKVETSGVKDLDAKSLPGGEHLLVARISNNTLIGVVQESWGGETVENKRLILQSLIALENKHQYKTVLLFNSKGEIVGNATAREVTAK